MSHKDELVAQFSNKYDEGIASWNVNKVLEEFFDQAQIEKDAEIERLKFELHGEIERSRLYAKGRDLIVEMRNVEIDALKSEIDRLKQENFNYSEVQVQLKWAKETNSELLSEIERLKRYELEYKKREWDEAILYNNLFKASMLVSELANALKARQTDGDTPKYTESVSKLIKKADEITYQPKDQNAVGNLEHSMEG